MYGSSFGQVGPHFSVVSLPGAGTEDKDGTKDGKEVKNDAGRVSRVLTDELLTKAEALEGKTFKLNLSSPSICYLLGAASNDDATNGPAMVTASHDAVRPDLDKIRALLGLKPFPREHSVHTTLCKITGANDDHAAFRELLTGWQYDGAYPKKLDSLSEVLPGAELRPPQLAAGQKLPSKCSLDVINTALKVASKVATEGVGEKQEAKGFMIIIGDRSRLLKAGVIDEAAEIGEAPEKKYNRFDADGRKITIFQVEKDGKAQRFVYPVFTTDGALVIDGEDGELLASNYTVKANLTNGSQAGGKKQYVTHFRAQHQTCTSVRARRYRILTRILTRIFTHSVDADAFGVLAAQRCCIGRSSAGLLRHQVPRGLVQCGHERARAVWHL